jgi:hypothetical protein
LSLAFVAAEATSTPPPPPPSLSTPSPPTDRIAAVAEILFWMRFVAAATVAALSSVNFFSFSFNVAVERADVEVEADDPPPPACCCCCCVCAAACLAVSEGGCKGAVSFSTRTVDESAAATRFCFLVAPLSFPFPFPAAVAVAGHASSGSVAPGRVRGQE